MVRKRRSKFLTAPGDSYAPVVDGTFPLIKLWSLRMLVLANVLPGRESFEQVREEDLFAKLGLPVPKCSDSDDEFKMDTKEFRALLRSNLRDAEADALAARSSNNLTANIERLATTVGLNDTESRLLEFAVLLQTDQLLAEIGAYLGALNDTALVHVLSVLLNLPKQQVHAAIQRKSALVESGLLDVNSGYPFHIDQKLELLTKGFAHQIAFEETEPLSLLRESVQPGGPIHLDIGHYGHLISSLRILLPYLKHAVTNRVRGVNIFLHGLPGTGKTQLSRLLAKELGCDLFEVSCEDGDGDPVEGEQRLRALRAAQMIFRHSTSLMVFDEAEDVFRGESLWPSFFKQDGQGVAQGRKGWLNRMLENNPTPMLWLSNTVGDIDPAFVRRFDMLIELPIPPRHQREQMLRTIAGDFLDAAALNQFADSEFLAPAVVARSAAVVGAIRNELGDKEIGGALELLINNTLTAQGHAPILKHAADGLPEIYDPAFIQADADLARIAEGLRHTRTGRICLYGPPGTGKTAYGRWLARQLEMPLHVRRASDLLSMWVGESEKNIAAAFRSAEREGALLLIDEVDSFLQDRRGAQQSWEVTQVNEMLTQMEAYSGIFIASTNLMQGLDPAVLRRFDLKVRFDFLRPEQAEELLRRHCRERHLPEPTPVEFDRVRRLAKLTPGDFAAVARQSRFRPLTSATALVTALEGECAVKEGGRGMIGFI